MEHPKKTTGITFSCFDLLHAGHIRMLAEAKTQCDHLIVGLQTDPTIDRPEKNSPTQTVVERYIQLAGCKYVDEIIPYTTEKDLEDLLKLYQIDVRILGAEYRDKDFTARSFCKDNNITLYFNERLHRFSTTNLRKEVYRSEDSKLNLEHNPTTPACKQRELKLLLQSTVTVLFNKDF